MKKGRVNEIDLTRGICILLMIMDHLFLLYLNLIAYNFNNSFNLDFYNFCNMYISNDIRKMIRIIVVCIFFAISGISCNFSRKNSKRAFKLFLSSILLTITTALISYYTKFDCLILCGVLHCYTIYIFLYCIFEKILKNKDLIWFLNVTLLFFIIAMFFFIFKFKAISTNAYLFLGVPAKDYIAPFEYVSPPLFAWAFFLGVYLGKRIYNANNQTRLKIKVPIICWIGSKGIYFYILHLPLIGLLILLT